MILNATMSRFNFCNWRNKDIITTGSNGIQAYPQIIQDTKAIGVGNLAFTIVNCPPISLFSWSYQESADTTYFIQVQTTKNFTGQFIVFSKYSLLVSNVSTYQLFHCRRVSQMNVKRYKIIGFFWCWADQIDFIYFLIEAPLKGYLFNNYS